MYGDMRWRGGGWEEQRQVTTGQSHASTLSSLRQDKGSGSRVPHDQFLRAPYCLSVCLCLEIWSCFEYE